MVDIVDSYSYKFMFSDSSGCLKARFTLELVTSWKVPPFVICIISPSKEEGSVRTHEDELYCNRNSSSTHERHKKKGGKVGKGGDKPNEKTNNDSRKKPKKTIQENTPLRTCWDVEEALKTVRTKTIKVKKKDSLSFWFLTRIRYNNEAEKKCV